MTPLLHRPTGPPDPEGQRSNGADPFVQLAETLTGVVFFVGGRAYKLKKPVTFGFLDFSSPEARRRACYREVALKSRLGPDVYLGHVCWPTAER